MRLEKWLLRFVAGGLLILGLMVFSGCVKQDTLSAPETTETTQTVEQTEGEGQEPVPAQEEKPDMVVNGSFTEGIDGWVLAGGRIRTEAGGNNYLEAENNWQNYQIVKLEENAVYNFNASTRRHRGEQEARLKIVFFDNHAQRLGWYSIHYRHQGNEWENIPVQTIKVPDGTGETILYLLADREKEVHDFDNISLTKEGTEGAPVKGEEIDLVFNTSPEKLANGAFDFDSGWSGLDTRIKTDDNGNRYLNCGYHWEVSQIAPVMPDKKYLLNAATKKGTSSGPARFVIVFFDNQGEKLTSAYNFSYMHQGNDWENIPAEIIDVPEGASKARLYLLSDYSFTGTHYYDNISLKEAE